MQMEGFLCSAIYHCCEKIPSRWHLANARCHMSLI